jgi:hypothetical protein
MGTLEKIFTTERPVHKEEISTALEGIETILIEIIDSTQFLGTNPFGKEIRDIIYKNLKNIFGSDTIMYMLRSKQNLSNLRGKTLEEFNQGLENKKTLLKEITNNLRDIRTEIENSADIETIEEIRHPSALRLTEIPDKDPEKIIGSTRTQIAQQFSPKSDIAQQINSPAKLTKQEHIPSSIIDPEQIGSGIRTVNLACIRVLNNLNDNNNRKKSSASTEIGREYRQNPPRSPKTPLQRFIDLQ